MFLNFQDRFVDLTCGRIVHQAIPGVQHYAFPKLCTMIDIIQQKLMRPWTNGVNDGIYEMQQMH